MRMLGIPSRATRQLSPLFTGRSRLKCSCNLKSLARAELPQVQPFTRRRRADMFLGEASRARGPSISAHFSVPSVSEAARSELLRFARRPSREATASLAFLPQAAATLLPKRLI